MVAAQPADVRNRAARRITPRSLAPSLGALPLAALMIWIAVAYGLRPLVRITQDLRKRSHRDLLPLDVSRLPPDIAPLAEALNDLMGRLDGIISTQRTFIADAAHELLTPLTALRLQAQMLARSRQPFRRKSMRYRAIKTPLSARNGRRGPVVVSFLITLTQGFGRARIASKKVSRLSAREELRNPSSRTCA